MWLNSTTRKTVHTQLERNISIKVDADCYELGGRVTIELSLNTEGLNTTREIVTQALRNLVVGCGVEPEEFEDAMIPLINHLIEA